MKQEGIVLLPRRWVWNDLCLGGAIPRLAVIMNDWPPPWPGLPLGRLCHLMLQSLFSQRLMKL